MNLFEEVPPDLKDEFDYQLHHFRELRQKYKIKDDVFELYSFKVMFLFRDFLWSGMMTQDDVLCAIGFFAETQDLYQDFEVMLNELENQKGE